MIYLKKYLRLLESMLTGILEVQCYSEFIKNFIYLIRKLTFIYSDMRASLKSCVDHT